MFINVFSYFRKKIFSFLKCCQNFLWVTARAKSNLLSLSLEDEKDSRVISFSIVTPLTVTLNFLGIGPLPCLLYLIRNLQVAFYLFFLNQLK